MERARRVAFLIDAAEYFEALATALELARSQILIAGWDLHSQTPLRRPHGDKPQRLIEVLRTVLQKKPELELYVLLWHPSLLYALEREFFPAKKLCFKLGARAHVRYAQNHRPGVSYHPKLVCIDRELAFAGGIDLTIARWDTPEHDPETKLRRLPDGSSYGPFHDVQLAMAGAAAHAIDSLIRENWQTNTGTTIPLKLAPNSDPWPPELKPDLLDAEVGIARTSSIRGAKVTSEIKRLYLDAIASAERLIYIENQFITAPAIRDALCSRLGERNGPRVIIVTPQAHAGLVEESTMGALKIQLLKELKQADAHGHLLLACPVVGKTPVNLHSKVMIIDEKLATIGSANLTTRSLELDTECNIALEGRGRDTVAQSIARLRERLLTEHLGVDSQELADSTGPDGSVHVLMERYKHRSRRLEQLSARERSSELPPSLVDPKRPLDEAVVRHCMPDGVATKAALRRLPRMMVVLLLLLGFPLLWALPPLNDWVAAESLWELGQRLQRTELSLLFSTFAFVILTVLMFPVTVLIFVAVWLFGPWLGFAFSLLGSLASASLSFAIGRWLGGDKIRWFVRARLEVLSRALVERGFLTTVTLRIIPAAPFGLVNLILGGSGLRRRDFLLGTLVGMAPGLLIMAHTFHRVIAAVKHPSPLSIVVAAFVVVAMAIVLSWFRRLLQRATRGDSLT